MYGDKLKPLVIENVFKSRYFKGIDVSKLEIEW
jgi:hypothetical protein